MHPLRENPSVQAFVSLAAQYCRILETPMKDRDLFLQDVLFTLAAVYAAAAPVRVLGLPELAGRANIPQSMQMTNDEWTLLYTYLKTMLGPQSHYAAYFNPTLPEPGVAVEPTPGDLADDLADIYRDLKPGLSAFATGEDAYLDDLLFQWTHHGHVYHWGRHAVDAMRALHWLVYR